MDNLEGATYEVFERDPVKYALYQEAVYKALLARPAGERTLIWVCGAGRGPLVSRCLAAAADAGRDIKIVALEKNPSAMIALQEKQAKEWGADTVELRFGDMRTATRPVREEERADILVSELLGSFGDNELSPECLDGACRFIKKNGISIPSAYTSYITPLSSAKLHSEILSSGSSSAATSSGPSVSGNNPTASTQAQIKAAETPFVVLFGAVDLPASENGPAGREKIQECWTFAHGPIEDLEIPLDGTGLPISNSHNVRTTSHTFSIPNTTLCHGLAGYFEAHLYGDVSLSIHPDPTRGSTDMLSWFPIYFPLKEPLYLPAGSELDVHLWRLTAERKVWYEWSCEVFLNIVSPGGAAGGAANGRPSSAMTVMGGTSSPDPSQWQQQQHGGGGGPGGASPLLGSHLNNPHYAFANAVNTPRIPSYGFPSDAQAQYNRRASGSTDSAIQPVNGRSVSSQGHYQPPGGAGAAAGGGGGGVGGYAVQRVKIGMSSLQNPNGRSSWVGM
jgi:protein arginine N-methyltransferase 5